MDNNNKHTGEQNKNLTGSRCSPSDVFAKYNVYHDKM